ncbi:MAG: SDR family oxidoreductase [Phycisphaerae bacterium]
METRPRNVVTGAFSYTGKYITRRLLSLGESVTTLTGHPRREDPFRGRVSAVPFHFDQPGRLVENLRGAATLYNTYWVRFSYKGVTFDQAIANTKTLIKAAEEAGVQRFVHMSITNPSRDSPLRYFSGKAELEDALRRSRLSYAIIRPTVVFGGEDVLINNIAWLLRRFPIFVLPGRGDYRLQPVFVEDLAEIAVNVGQRDDNVAIDAAGPEAYTFRELVRLIADTIGSRAAIVPGPRWAALTVARLIGYVTRDIVLTREEAEGLMADLLVSADPPRGQTRLSDWLNQNSDRVGSQYASELRRHFT